MMVILFVLAGLTPLVFRLVWVVLNPELSFRDEVIYLDLARHLAVEGRYALSPEYGFALRWPPGLPLLLAAVGMVAPVSALTALVVNSLLSWGTILVYAVAVGWVTRRPIAVAAMLLAGGLHPSFLFLGATSYPHTLQAFTMAMLVLGMAWVARPDAPGPPRSGHALWMGAWLGIGALAVPANLFIVPAVLLWLYLIHPARILPHAFLALIGLALVVGPWTLRNLHVEKEFTLISASAGQQIFYGYNEKTDMNAGAMIPIPDSLQARLATAQSAKEADRAYWQYGMSWIRENPGRAIGLYGLKFLNFFRWDTGPLFTRTEETPFRTWVARGTTLVVFSLFMAGAVFLWRAQPHVVYTAGAMILLSAAGYALFITRYRYRLPLEPLMLFVGVWGWHLRRQFPEKDRPT